MMTDAEKQVRKSHAETYDMLQEAMKKAENAAWKAHSHFIDDEFIEGKALMDVAAEYLALAKGYHSQLMEIRKELAKFD